MLHDGIFCVLFPERACNFYIVPKVDIKMMFVALPAFVIPLPISEPFWVYLRIVSQSKKYVLKIPYITANLKLPISYSRF